jgi:acyl-ACP thioesterase
VRAADLDVLGHVNNAVHWAAVEEVLAGRNASVRMRAELEHGVGIGPEHEVVLLASDAEGSVESWLMADGVAASVARLTPLD